MKFRSEKKELIDLGSEFYTAQEYDDCLKKLGDVGRFLGGNSAGLSAFNQLKIKPQSILDVGCGGGYFTNILAKKFPQAKVTGIDYSSKAIEHAKKHNSPNLSFHVPTTLELNIPEKSVDIITATLVCHHMNDTELIDFLKRAKTSARKKVIINDLHRHPIAYFFYGLIAPILFRNRLITHDGLISIKRSFTKNEWVSYLKKAGFNKDQYTIKWKFPFRWIITINL